MKKSLSSKQESIIDLIVEGKTVCGVAAEHGMAVSTVSTHLTRIKRKLGAKTLEQAAVFWDRTKRPQET